ncbi:Saccharopine dehydrogenase-domain-containing protein [Phycomyces nitens]|nr:Saccharopine dehydrogenase-domain-containing protein [Phycomyces nitens]
MVSRMASMAYRGILSNSRRGLKTNCSQTNPRSVGLRREDKSRWERRAALTPTTVEQLIKDTGSRIYVQPSTKRIFSDESYKKAGAIVTEDISAADIILGIKEVPEESLLPKKTYLFFSHSHKGNQKNMSMLKNILEKDIRLIDYELMKDSTGKRLVAFGQFAGNAGMVDSLHGMGHRFLGMGYSTPFMYLAMAHGYKSLQDARQSVGAMGEMIKDQKTPKDFGPLVFGFTGAGNVAHGALDIFKELPHEFVAAKDLPLLVNDKNPNLSKLYATHLAIPDYIQHRDGSPCVDPEDYLRNPSAYQSVFHQKVAPFVNTVVTGGYWDERYPRLLTNAQLKELQLQQQIGHVPRGKMMTLADIVCDVKGAFEPLSHSTNIDNGFFYYDAINGREHENAEEPGMQIMGIDILPAELPIESSQHFSNVLYPHLKELVTSSAVNLSDLSATLANATIADKGHLTKEHKGLEAKLPLKSKSLEAIKAETVKLKTVLLLGSGMVAGPLVEHLLKRPDVRVVVASNMENEAKALVRNHSRAESVGLDISNVSQLSGLVSKADVVVSFVPAFLHTKVAKICIEERKHMVTASYVSDEMQQLDSLAKKAGVLIMNEVGLDPGIDHMSAMKIIDEAKRQGSKIRSFISWCGGLPAPEASNGPLGYKFSWSPRGVLTASGNTATYWTGGKKFTIPGEALLKQHFPAVRTSYKGFVFEGLANRDSLSYVDTYGLGNLADMDTMFRGTLRYQGYSDVLYGFKKLGFLDQTSQLSKCASWDGYFDQILNSRHPKDRMDAMVQKLGLPKDHPMVEDVWDAMSALSQTNNIQFPQNVSPLDAFSVLLANKLQYLPGERDMVAMHHEFGIEHSSGKKETVTSTLVHYGNEHHTAMATTVGLPAAMTTELVLDNKIPERGVLRPTSSHVYLPVLDQLEHVGVQFVESVQASHPIRLDATGSGAWN